jgi:hypothetical protein
MTNAARVSPATVLRSLNDCMLWFNRSSIDSWKRLGFRTADLISRYPYGEPTSVSNYTYYSMAQTLTQCYQNRRDRLNELLQLPFDAVSLGGGRLLRHNLCESTNTDIPRLETENFFDSWDLPPWDLWVTFVSDATCDPRYGYLICWIPPALVDVVDRSVRSSFEENNVWLNWTIAKLSNTGRAE